MTLQETCSIRIPMRLGIRALAQLGLLLIFSQTSFALDIEITHSEATSYLHFLNSGFGEPFTSASMNNLIKLNEMNVFKKPEMKEKFEHFKSFLQKGYNFDDEIANRPEGFWADDALTALAANSATLAIFEKQLSMLVPYRGILSYYEVKKEAYPLFSKTVWSPTKNFQDGEERNLKKILKKTNFLALLENARTFYRSNYPEILPFKVALIPIPDEGIEDKHTSATSLRDVQIVPYLTSLGATGSLDVVFHEFCHALYEGQSLKLKNEINDFYLKNSDSHALFVYRYLNEALATAWGNGWYKEVLDGKLSAKSWYTVKYIDQLARAYLPLIKDYSSRGKPMDLAFMRDTIQIAKKIFPNAPRELATNMMALNVLIDFDDHNSNSLKDEFRKRFRVQSLYVASPMKEEDLVQTKDGSMRTTFLVTKEKAKTLKRARNIIDLSPISKTIENQSDFLAIIPDGSKYFFWMNIENQASMAKLLSKLSELELLPNKPSVLLN